MRFFICFFPLPSFFVFVFLSSSLLFLSSPSSALTSTHIPFRLFLPSFSSFMTSLPRSFLINSSSVLLPYCPSLPFLVVFSSFVLVASYILLPCRVFHSPLLLSPSFFVFVFLRSCCLSLSIHLPSFFLLHFYSFHSLSLQCFTSFFLVVFYLFVSLFLFPCLSSCFLAISSILLTCCPFLPPSFPSFSSYSFSHLVSDRPTNRPQRARHSSNNRPRSQI